MSSDLDPELIDARLRGNFGRPLRAFEEITSTNDAALEWALGGAPEGAVVLADYQTQGRGRWGRQWYSDPGTGLLFSLVLRSGFGAGRSGLLVTALGVGCAEGIEAATGLEVAIKWPNDLLVGGRKVAGILVETKSAGTSTDVAVAGIGANVSGRPGDLPPDISARASSLAAELARSGRPAPERSAVLVEVLAAIEDHHRKLLEGASDRLVDEAAARSAVLGSHVNVRFADGSEVAGVATGLDPSGALQLDTPAGPTAVTAGEVEQIRPAEAR